MSRKIMQQALDALETIPAGGADLNQLALTVAGVTLALRAALAAPQGEPVKGAVWHEGSVSLLSVGHEDAYCARRGAQRLYLHPPAAPSVPASPWIACSERMPDADIEVLAWVVGEPFWDGHCWIATYDGLISGWNADEGRYALRGVTHWMDLPEAPSGEGAK